MVESTLNSLLDGLSSTVNPILSGLNYGLQLSYLGFNVTADIKPVRGLELTDKQASLFLNGTIFDTNNPKNFNYPNSAFSAPTIN